MRSSFFVCLGIILSTTNPTWNNQASMMRIRQKTNWTFDRPSTHRLYTDDKYLFMFFTHSHFILKNWKQLASP